MRSPSSRDVAEADRNGADRGEPVDTGGSLYVPRIARGRSSDVYACDGANEGQLRFLQLFTLRYWRRRRAMDVLMHARYYTQNDFDAVHILIDAYFKVQGSR